MISPAIPRSNFEVRSSTREFSSAVLARPEGLEPPTYGFEARRSIQLSYGRTDSQAYHTGPAPFAGAAPLVGASPERRGVAVRVTAQAPHAVPDRDRCIEDRSQRQHAAELVVAERAEADRREAAALRAVRIAAVLARA